MGHDRKSPAVLPCPGRLDGGIEGQKMRLPRDALNVVGYLADLEEQFQGLDGCIQRVGDGLAHALQAGARLRHLLHQVRIDRVDGLDALFRIPAPGREVLSQSLQNAIEAGKLVRGVLNPFLHLADP